MLITLISVAFAACPTYQLCQSRFNQAKTGCAHRYGGYGTQHGRCVDWAVRSLDTCIATADRCQPARPYSYHGLQDDEEEDDQDNQQEWNEENQAQQNQWQGQSQWNQHHQGQQQNQWQAQPQWNQQARSAQVSLRPDVTNPNGTNVKGVATFEQNNPRAETKVTLTISGLPPNTQHGWHIHQLGTIFPNCTAAGLHFNPENVNHGDRLAQVRHVGDLGNFKTNDKGEAHVEFNDRLVSLFGDRSVLGRTLVIHNNQDDLGLNPNSPDSKTVGTSGSRLSCGVIGVASGF